MSYIIENLYLGDSDDAVRSHELKQRKGVTHIMTVDCKPLSVDAREGFVYLHVFAVDTDAFDLLKELGACLEFIDSGRRNGAILVHCWAGQSRSAAVVLAYVMKHLSLSLSEAEDLVRTQRPIIRPNDGFMRQLGLYESMGWRADPSFPAYRRYRLELLAQRMQTDYRDVESRCQSELTIASVSARTDHQLPYCPGGQMSNVRLNDQLPLDCLADDPSCVPAASGPAGDAVYRCAKCRRPLFRQSGVVTHEPSHSVVKQQAKGQRSAEKREFRSAGNTCDIFIEPVAWMASMVLSIEGKVSDVRAVRGSPLRFTSKGQRLTSVGLYLLYLPWPEIPPDLCRRVANRLPNSDQSTR